MGPPAKVIDPGQPPPSMVFRRLLIYNDSITVAETCQLPTCGEADSSSAAFARILLCSISLRRRTSELFGTPAALLASLRPPPRCRPLVIPPPQAREVWPPRRDRILLARMRRLSLLVALVGLSSGAQALSTSRGVAAFRPRAGVVRCAEPEWSPQEDWALQDQVKAYSAGTGADTATFWSALAVNVPALSARDPTELEARAAQLAVDGGAQVHDSLCNLSAPVASSTPTRCLLHLIPLPPPPPPERHSRRGSGCNPTHPACKPVHASASNRA